MHALLLTLALSIPVNPPLVDMPPPQDEDLNRPPPKFRERRPPPPPREERWFCLPCVWIVGTLAFLPSLVLLAFLLREMTRGRREATRKLSMLANVSHEFRTPLTNLKLYAELLQNAPSMPPEERNRFLGIIASETERLTRLVNNVLDYGRLTENRKKYNLQDLDLPRLLHSVVERLQEKLHQVGLTLTIEGVPEATVQADADAVQQVAVNLIDNAIKYAAEGKTIELLVSQTKETTSFAVIDHGHGISTDDARHIFDRFFRCDDSLTSSIGGTGLGLDIAKGLMTGMNGKLVYRPNPTGGCIFEAQFPTPSEETVCPSES